MSRWTHILSAGELDSRRDLTASIDCRFARNEREFYETRTAADLRALTHQAWLCNEADSYQMARSYLALRFPDPMRAQS